MTSRSEKIVICLAGLTACGKSTVARRLAQKFNLDYVSGGTALKKLALKLGYKAKERGWWESAEGLRFLEDRTRDQQLDKQVDHELLKMAKKGNIVLDSWTMPWLSKTGFKIWLEVSPEERANRLTYRDHITQNQAKRIIKEKDGKTRQIYEKLYGFKLGEDYSPFDLILDSELLSADEVYDILSFAIKRLVLQHSR
jgi:cytidylate kinase